MLLIKFLIDGSSFVICWMVLHTICGQSIICRFPPGTVFSEVHISHSVDIVYKNIWYVRTSGRVYIVEFCFLNMDGASNKRLIYFEYKNNCQVWGLVSELSHYNMKYNAHMVTCDVTTKQVYKISHKMATISQFQLFWCLVCCYLIWSSCYHNEKNVIKFL